MQRWIWDQGWSELRDIQEMAVAPILAREDVIISAATASGKTEAAFLPILTAVEPLAGPAVDPVVRPAVPTRSSACSRARRA